MTLQEWEACTNKHQYSDFLAIGTLPSGGLAYYDPKVNLCYGGVMAVSIITGGHFAGETTDYRARYDL